jgi:signal transduction histidine kinase/DNA-binding response OmpR family regulator
MLKKAIIILLPFFLASLIFPLAQAQSYLINTRDLTTKDGLSHNQTLCTQQDSMGFIWIGTKYGLNRYDGHEFRWFTKEKNGLSSNEINQIYPDHQGRLWLVNWEERHGTYTFISIDLFDPSTHEVTAFSDLKSPFRVKDLQAIHSMENNRLIFSVTNGGYFLFSADTGFEEFPLPSGFSLHYAVDDEELWGSRGGSLIQINKEGRISRSFPIQEGRFVRKVTCDGWNRYWVVIGQKQPGLMYETAQINVLEGDTLRPVFGNKKFYDSRGMIRILPMKSNNDVLWVREREIVRFGKDLDKPLFRDSTILKENPIQWKDELFVDEKGLSWYAHRDGLTMIDIRLSPFQQYLRDEELGEFSTRGLAEYEGKLFVNTNSPHHFSGYYDLNQKVWNPYSRSYPQFDGFKAFPLYLTSEGELWTANDHLFQFDRNGNLLQELGERGKFGGRIWAFFKDASGAWWIGGKPMYFFNENQQDSPRPFDRYNGFDELKKTDAWHFLEDERGIWIASDKGLYLLKKGKGIVAGYGELVDTRHKIPGAQFYYIHKDKDGDLWLATGNAGLIKLGFDEEEKPVVKRHLTRADGLPSNELYAIFEDNHNHLWISSGNGLIQYGKETGEINVFFEEQGITHNEFNRLSFFQSKTGRIYFGGMNGVTAFSPDDFYNRPPYDAPLRLSSIKLFSGKEEKLIDITNETCKQRKINFRPGDKFITMKLSLQDYFFSEKVKYSYRIQGLSQSWEELYSNALQLSGLPYGRHTLEIRAKGPDNRYSTQQLTLDINVLRPFFLQSWFLLTFAFVIAATIWQWYRWRIRSYKKRQVLLEKLVQDRTQKIREDKLLIEEQAEQLRELDELKSRFFANISHELRTPLTLILGPLENMLNSKKLDNREFTLMKLMQQNGKQLLKRINELLDLSSLDANKLKIDKSPVQLYSYTKQLLSLFESGANLKKIRLTLDFQLDQHIQVLFDADKVEKIVTNFLSNAVKFTPENGQIGMSVRPQKGKLEISVSDSGLGIPEEEIDKVFDRFYQAKGSDKSTGTGIGLALCRELAQLMEGRVWAESELGKGSTFFLELPLEESFDQLEPESAPAGAEAFALDIPENQSGERILVVEDNPSLLQYIQFLLEPYQVITAENGKAGLEKLEELQQSGQAVNLIISDIMMPVMDGFALLEAVKNNDDFRHIPVIMLTARQNQEVKLEALRIGVDDYMVKPFQETELLARVANLIRNSRERLAAIQPTTTEKKASQKPQGKAVLTAADTKWLKEIEQYILDNMGNPQFGISQLAEELALSPRRFQQKIKELTGLTPKTYQREIQLEYGRRLLESGDYQTVSEVSYQIGFKDAHYFSTLFFKRFGKKPNDYLS